MMIRASHWHIESPAVVVSETEPAPAPRPAGGRPQSESEAPAGPIPLAAGQHVSGPVRSAAADTTSSTLPSAKTRMSPETSGNPYPITNPPFYVISHGYDMDITTSGIFFSKMSYPYHIHVISFFQKRCIWIYRVYPKLKKLHLVYTWYIFSCHMPCLSMSYPCHKFVRLSGAGRK